MRETREIPLKKLKRYLKSFGVGGTFTRDEGFVPPPSDRVKTDNVHPMSDV